VRARVVGSSVLWLVFSLLACDGDGPSEPAGIAVLPAVPVVAFEGSGVDCAVFPVRIRDLGRQGGSLDSLTTRAIRSADGTVLATNRRPNVDFAFPSTALPPGGELEVEAGACWPPQPARTLLEVRIEAEVDPGNRRASTQVPMTGPRD
jgi:hypothetical protein